MQQTSFPVEYDFKCAELDLIDEDTGMIKNKYKCLPLMITLPLSRPIIPLDPPNQPDPTYKKTILKSVSNNNGWLNFIPLENTQPNIITIESNMLLINKYSYNYDITVDIINKGNDNVDLRFMAQNPFSLLASNMNDINLDETVFSDIYDGQKIKFTIIGEYQFFYVNYPTTNFDINITIKVSDIDTPIFICNKICDKCNKRKNCTCFDIKGNGYIKIKHKGEFIYVPVYKTRILGDSLNRYLYPEFGYLRDLFYQITLSNSLEIPTPDSTKILSTTIVNCTFGTPCSNKLGQYNLISGDLVEIVGSSCPNNQIHEIKQATYRYSWEGSSVPIAITNPNVQINQEIYLVIRLWYLSYWYEFARFKLNKTRTSTDFQYYSYSLDSGFYDNLNEYRWVKFDVVAGQDSSFLIADQPSFNVTITEI